MPACVGSRPPTGPKHTHNARHSNTDMGTDTIQHSAYTHEDDEDAAASAAIMMSTMMMLMMRRIRVRRMKRMIVVVDDADNEDDVTYDDGEKEDADGKGSCECY